MSLPGIPTAVRGVWVIDNRTVWLERDGVVLAMLERGPVKTTGPASRVTTA